MHICTFIEYIFACGLHKKTLASSCHGAGFLVLSCLVWSCRIASCLDLAMDSFEFRADQSESCEWIQFNWVTNQMGKRVHFWSMGNGCRFLLYAFYLVSFF